MPVPLALRSVPCVITMFMVGNVAGLVLQEVPICNCVCMWHILDCMHVLCISNTGFDIPISLASLQRYCTACLVVVSEKFRICIKIMWKLCEGDKNLLHAAPSVDVPIRFAQHLLWILITHQSVTNVERVDSNACCA